MKKLTIILFGLIGVVYGQTVKVSPGINVLAASDTVNRYIRPIAGTNMTITGIFPNLTFSSTASGSGTVTAVSVATVNGFAGTSSGGATPIITLTTPITGVLKGNGTAISAATAGIDYQAPLGFTPYNATNPAGYISSYTETDPIVKAITGLVKSNGTTISAAVAGTDYLTPSGNGAALTGITESQVTNLVTDLALKAPLASPTFTGTPTLPTGTIATTQTAGNNTTALATTAFVTTAVGSGAVNLTGPITSVGNATSIASQTGTGTTFAMATSPTFTTSIITPQIAGSTAAGGNLQISSTTSATKGKIFLGTSSVYDGLNERLAIGTQSPTDVFEVKAGNASTTYGGITGITLWQSNTSYPTKFRAGSNYDGTYLTQNAGYNGTSWVNDVGARGAGGITFNTYSQANADIIFYAGPSGSTATPATQRMILTGSNGNLGIGVTAPTAELHLRAGTATAGTAPLKFTAGVNLTTAEDGTVEYDGTHFYGSIGATRYQLDQQSGGLTSANFIFNEQFTGSTSSTYTLANTPVAGKLSVFKNGMLITDYTLSGAVVTLGSARLTTDIFTNNYIK